MTDLRIWGLKNIVDPRLPEGVAFIGNREDVEEWLATGKMPEGTTAVELEPSDD